MIRSEPPAVSVCVPAYNAEPWIARAVESALAQTYGDLEVVVVDDASTDGTSEQVNELEDPRVRLFTNVHTLGHSRNWNRSLTLSRGALIKFLSADDVLYPDCVEAMVALFRAHPNVGLVFSRRDVEAESPADPAVKAWKAKHLDPHEILGDLTVVNSGPALVRRCIQEGLGRNAIGEPTNVMMARTSLQAVGTFNVRVKQRADMDLWLRAAMFYDVGFVDRPLARYAIRSGSVTSVNQAGGLNWMDGLWSLEGLLAYDGVARRWPQLATLRRRAAVRCLRHALRRAMGGDWSRLGALLKYVVFRARGDARTRLHGALDERVPAGETLEVGA